MKTILPVLVLTLSATPALGQTTPSDCAVRLLTAFSTSVIDLKRQAERAAQDTSATLESFVSRPLRLQYTMQEASAHFRVSFGGCPTSIVEAAKNVADTFDAVAKGYASAVQTGKTAWLLMSKAKNAGSQAELKRITEEIDTLRIAMAEQTVDMERRNSLLPQIAVLVFGSVIGSSSIKDRVALLLTEKDKQKTTAEIRKLCAGQCVFKAGTEYPYAAVGLILDKLQEPFLLNGTPFEK